MNKKYLLISFISLGLLVCNNVVPMERRELREMEEREFEGEVKRVLKTYRPKRARRTRTVVRTRRTIRPRRIKRPATTKKVVVRTRRTRRPATKKRVVKRTRRTRRQSVQIVPRKRIRQEEEEPVMEEGEVILTLDAIEKEYDVPVERFFIVEVGQLKFKDRGALLRAYRKAKMREQLTLPMARKNIRIFTNEIHTLQSQHNAEYRSQMKPLLKRLAKLKPPIKYPEAKWKVPTLPTRPIKRRLHKHRLQDLQERVKGLTREEFEEVHAKKLSAEEQEEAQKLEQQIKVLRRQLRRTFLIPILIRQVRIKALKDVFDLVD